MDYYTIFLGITFGLFIIAFGYESYRFRKLHDSYLECTKKVDELEAALEKKLKKELEEKIALEIQYKTMLLKYDIKKDLSDRIERLEDITFTLEKDIRKLTFESIGLYNDVF